MRLKTQYVIEFLGERLIEGIGCVDDPWALHEVEDGWSHFGDRVEAAEEQLLNILWMSFIDTIPEGFVEDLEVALPSAGFGVDFVEYFLIHLSKGEILKHDHQDRRGQPVDIGRSHLVGCSAVNLKWPVVPGASLMADSCIKLLGVPQVDQGKLVRIVKHQVIWLDVWMSKSVVGVDVENGRAQLLDKVTL